MSRKLLLDSKVEKSEEFPIWRSTPDYDLITLHINKVLVEETRSFIKKIYDLRGYIAGGFARFLVSPHSYKKLPFNDIDIFSWNKRAYTKLNDFLQEEASFRFESEFSVTYLMHLSIPSVCEGYRECVLQLIKPTEWKGRKLWGAPLRVISQFDISVCQVFIAEGESGLPSFTGLATRQFNEDEFSKRITIMNIYDVPQILFRVYKYVKKGYSISSREFGKILRVLDTYSAGERLKCIEELESAQNCRCWKFLSGEY
mgnify:CR=1 FL=1